MVRRRDPVTQANSAQENTAGSERPSLNAYSFDHALFRLGEVLADIARLSTARAEVKVTVEGEGHNPAARSVDESSSVPCRTKDTRE